MTHAEVATCVDANVRAIGKLVDGAIDGIAFCDATKVELQRLSEGEGSTGEVDVPPGLRGVLPVRIKVGQGAFSGQFAPDAKVIQSIRLPAELQGELKHPGEVFRKVDGALVSIPVNPGKLTFRIMKTHDPLDSFDLAKGRFGLAEEFFVSKVSAHRNLYVGAQSRATLGN